MNDVDADNNIISDVPFWGSTSGKGADKTVELVRNILKWILTVILLLAVAYLLYRVYVWYKSTKSGKKDKSKKSMFDNDEEKTASSSAITASDSTGSFMGKLFGKPPPKKSTWQKVKGAFSKK